MVAIKSLAIFATIMFGLLGVPILFIALFLNEDAPPFLSSMAPLAMNLMPIFWIGSLVLGIYLAVQLGKQQV